jgi:hypothetical protein
MAQSKDLAIVIGKYTDRDGKERSRYKTVGQIITKDDGGEFIALDATCLTMEINYLANRDRRDRINVSIFSRDQEGQAARNDEARDNIPF